MAAYSPRRVKTSFDQYYDMSNSYDREVASRQGMVPLEYQLPQTMDPVPSYRPKTCSPTARTQINGHVPVTMVSGMPTSQMGYGPANHLALRPPSQSGYIPASQLAYKPPSQSGYRPPSQSGYRPPSQSGYRPPSQSGYRPPSQSGYRPPSQSGYRPPSQLEYRSPSKFMHNPEMDFQQPNYMSDEYNGLSYPGPDSYEEDQQIFVRKPRSTTVTPPIFRLGSHGAPWKHVKTVINSEGNHMCWIDGSVKQEENSVFPLYWNRDLPRRTYRPRNNKPLLQNSYNQRAKNGFKYWVQETPATKFTDYSKMHVHGNQVTFRA